MRSLLAVVALVTWASTALAERRVALIFGANTYDTLRPLKNAVNDARAIEDALEALDFEVFSEKNRDLKRMRRALEDFEEDATGADVAFVFFAGHGVEIAGDNRLLPTDADASTVDSLKATSLSLNEIQTRIGTVAKSALIVLDACRDDPFALRSDPAGRGAFSLEVTETVKPGLGRMGSADRTLFAFSAAPGETASDGDGNNSPFTTALTRYLGTEGLEIRSVLTLVQQEVYDRTNGRQLPYVESGLPNLFFASASAEELPERERLLLAMADIDNTARRDVERVALNADVPLAPLYSALISSDLRTLNREQRSAKLKEAAAAFTKVRDELRTLRSGDQRVSELRRQAEAHLSLGAFESARAKLTEAAEIDATSRETLKANYVERTLSEAASHSLNGGTARAELKYRLAVSDFEHAIRLFGEVAQDALPSEAWQHHLNALAALGQINMTIGNLPEAATAFAQQIAAAQSASAHYPQAPDLRLALAQAQDNLGDVLFEQGKIAEALDQYRRSHAIRSSTSDAAPDNITYTSALSVSHGRLGRIYFRQGNLAASEAEYLKKQRLGIAVLETDPDGYWWERDLSVSDEKLGDIQRARGDAQGAMARYEASLDRMRPIRDANPDDPELSRFISIALDRLGRIFLDEGELASALALFEESRAMRIALVDTDPANTDWQHLLGLSHEQIGDVLTRMNDQDAATVSYEAKHAIVSELVTYDPTNVRWLRDLSVADERLGGLAHARGDLAEAILHYQRSLDRMTPIRDANPTDMELNRFLSFTQNHLAHVRMDQGDTDAALALYQSSLELRQRLVAHDPQNADWRFILGVSHELIGNIYMQTDRPAKAVAAYQEELAVMLPLLDRDPASPKWNRVVSVTNELLGHAHLATGEARQALAHYTVSLNRMRTVSDANPDDLGALRFTGVTLRTIGDTHLAINERAAAVDAYAQSLSIAARLVAANAENGWWQRDLFLAYSGIVGAGGTPRLDQQIASTAAQKMQELGTMIPSDQPIIAAFEAKAEQVQRSPQNSDVRAIGVLD
ncbi:MAG: caspase family protein [Sulfitobacter sp.]